MTNAVPGGGTPGHDYNDDRDRTGNPCRDDQAHAVAESIIRRMSEGTEVNADLVHERMLPVMFCDARKISAVFRRLHIEGLLRPIGTNKTSRASAHCGFQTQWLRVSPDPAIAVLTSKLANRLRGVE